MGEQEDNKATLQSFEVGDIITLVHIEGNSSVELLLA